MIHIQELNTLIKAGLTLSYYQQDNQYMEMVNDWVNDYTRELLEELEDISTKVFSNLHTDTRVLLRDLMEREEEEEAREELEQMKREIIAHRKYLKEEASRHLENGFYLLLRMVTTALEQLEKVETLEDWKEYND